MRSLISFTSLAILLACTLSGCEEPTRPPSEKGKAVRIVVVGPGQDDPDWPVITACVSPAISNERTVTAEARAPVTASPALQREVLAALLNEPIDAVCLMPIDEDALVPEIARLSQSGRSVITFGRDVRDSARAAYVGPRESDIGTRAGQAVLTWLDDTRRSVIVVGPIADGSPYSLRYHEAREQMKIGGADVLREVDTSASPWNAAGRVRDESARFPRVACWLFLDEWPLLSDKVWMPLVPATSRVVVCGASPRWFGRLRRHEIHALIGYDMQQAVEGAIQTAIYVVRRNALGQRGRDLPAEVITLENIGSFERRRNEWLAGRKAGPDAGQP